MEKDYTSRLNKIDDLPAMPKTLYDVLNKLNSDDTNASTLDHIIEEDPALTTKILKIANSPYYGQAGTVNNIKRAIMLLGFNEIKNLVIGFSLSDIFNSGLECGPIDSKIMWLHSVGVGKVAQSISHRLKIGDPDDFFTGGLIHDIGLIIMCHHFKNETLEIFRLVEEKNISFPDAEEMYGLKHTEIGAFLAKKWALSDFMTNIIRYHHKPTSAGEFISFASVLFLANELCDKTGLGLNYDESGKKLLVPKSLHVNVEFVKELVDMIKEEKKTIEENWGNMLLV
jgi:putative nucleotidyltransferase with HDIG domain